MAYYPYKGFHFSVNIDGISGGGNDMSFQSVKGLEVQLDVENIKEGGLNTFEHNIPTRVKYSTLTLERGIFKPENSELIKWCQKAFTEFDFSPKTVTIHLLNDKGNPLIVWNITHAYPKSWKIKDLNSTQNEVLIETLELQYNSFTMEGKPY